MLFTIFLLSFSQGPAELSGLGGSFQPPASDSQGRAYGCGPPHLTYALVFTVHVVLLLNFDLELHDNQGFLISSSKQGLHQKDSEISISFRIYLQRGLDFGMRAGPLIIFSL